MISHESFTTEPWAVRETALHRDVLAQSESVFALSNGHIGMRGNLDEGEPHGLPGTYLNGFYELRPLPYAEAGYGYPESGQTVVNVTNGKLIRLLVDDEPFDVRYGNLTTHERVLDFRTGILQRQAVWTSPAGQTIEVTSQRLVSLTQRAVAAIRYRVTAVNDPARVVVQSELVANEEMPRLAGDPRAAAVLAQPLEAEEHIAGGLRAVLLHKTRASGLRLAAGMDHLVDGVDGVSAETESLPDWARTTVTAYLQPGEHLTLVKFLGYGWSSYRSRPALRDQVAAALAAAVHTGWDGLLAEQRDYLADFWEHADVELDGDAEVQQAARFALFHTLQAAARAERRAVPAKGLTGTGYDGHAFWDTETYVLPSLTYSAPSAVANALHWRHDTLPQARQRAQQLGLRGAAFPWRTIHGEECSGYWPAGTAAFHVNADVADAVVRYVGATGDEEFEQTVGLDLLVETARLWRSLGHHDRHGRFHIDGVTGPDEYSALARDNVYTNLMAQQNLLAAVDAAERWPAQAGALGVDDEEVAGWRDAAGAMALPYDDELQVHEQNAGFTHQQAWDFTATAAEQYPLLLHFPYFDLYRKQVVKQADLVLAMYLRGDAFTAEQKLRNFDYYEQFTVRDSSLSAAYQAVLAAEVGHLDLAYDYLGEAALVDLHDLQHNTHDGLHLAALAGSWLALVAGFGGLRHRGDQLSFHPRLPAPLTRLVFNLRFRGRHLRVAVTQRSATFLVVSGEPLAVRVGLDDVVLRPGEPVERAVPRVKSTPRPAQPHGREPGRRGAP